MKILRGNLLNRTVDGFLCFQLRHPVVILVIALILSGLSIYYTQSRLTVQTSQKDLISPQDRLIQLAGQTSQFTQMDSFIIVIKGPSPARSLEYLHKLAPLITANTENFQSVFYHIDPELFKPWALFYLDEKDLHTITRNIDMNADLIRDITSKPALDNFFELLNREMTSQMVGGLFTGFLDSADEGEKGPMDLDFLVRVLREMRKFLTGDGQFISPWTLFLATKSLDVDPAEGYFWTGENKRYLLCFVTPSKKDDFTSTSDALAALRNKMADLSALFPDIRAGVTGPEALNADQMKTAIGDMESATLISFVCLAVLYIYFRRGIRIPLRELTTMSIALSWSFGLTTLIIGHLNILSVTFAPLLLGLGDDFAAHWLARLREEELAHPGTKREILLSTSRKVGLAMLMAGLSLMLAFFPLILTGFKGLVELGLICTMGMIIMGLANLLLLPPLVQLFASLSPKIHSGTPMDWIKIPARDFIRLTRKRALVFISLGTAAFLAASWSATHIRFDLNMLNLQAENVESVVWEKELLKNSKKSSIFGEVLAPSLEEVRIKTEQLEALPAVSQAESVIDLIPKEQDEKMNILRRIRPLMDELAAIKPSSRPVDSERLASILNRIKSKMDPVEAAASGASPSFVSRMATVRRMIDEIDKLLQSRFKRRDQKALKRFETEFFRDLNDKLSILKANVNSNPMQVANLPEFLRERYIAKNGQFIIRVYPRDDVWDPPAMGRFVHEIRTVSPDAVGDPVTLYVFTQAFRDACVKAALYAVLFIFLFAVAIFRNLKISFLVLIPFLLGTVWTMGLMYALEINFNLANTLFLPLIVGASVEYGVVILLRWKQTGNNGGIILPQSTAFGILLAGLTTIAGFASLMISSHQGIFSLGLLATIGSLAVTAAALLYLPAVLYFIKHEERK